ncbi:MAG: hypothetical protein LBC74_08380, partial [Planctomycetaceae bacterium]|nr:hypothetical protein [Planctomycetaceae bacterium]
KNYNEKPPLTPPRPPLTPPKEGNKKMPPSEGNKKTHPSEWKKNTPPSEGNYSSPSEGSGVVSYRLAKRSTVRTINFVPSERNIVVRTVCKYSIY